MSKFSNNRFKSSFRHILSVISMACISAIICVALSSFDKPDKNRNRSGNARTDRSAQHPHHNRSNDSQRTEKYVVINGDNVRLRTSPSTANSSNIYSIGNSPYYLNKGTKVPYLGENAEWYKVLVNGNQLYVSKSFSYVTSSSAQVVETRWVKINGTNVLFRKTPEALSDCSNVYYKSDGTPRFAQKGERYQYLGEAGDWYRVAVDGSSYYVSKIYSYETK